MTCLKSFLSSQDSATLILILFHPLGRTPPHLMLIMKTLQTFHPSGTTQGCTLLGPSMTNAAVTTCPHPGCDKVKQQSSDVYMAAFCYAMEQCPSVLVLGICLRVVLKEHPSGA